MEKLEQQNKTKTWASALLPIILLIVLLVFFIKFGPLGVLKSTIAPIEKLFIQRVIFSPEHITLDVLNDGPEPVTVAQVHVNDAYWKFEIDKKTLHPLERAKIRIAYPWLEGDFEKITVVSSTGLTFTKEVEAANITPTFNFHYFKTFVLLGIYVGVIPVLLGLLWLNFLKKLRERWYTFLLSLTVGLLAFLGFEAFAESIELIGTLPQSLNGVGILVIGFLLSVLALSAVSHKTESLTKERGEHFKALIFGYLIALGIGLHNLGEGLAIGSAYAVGKISLGSLLVIGFMVHNVTEGVAIIAPVARIHKLINRFYLHLVLMGVIAGAPTILGTLIGGFSYTPALRVFFLAVGSGAIFDVAFDITHQMSKGRWLSLFTVTNVIGFLAGLLVIYATGFLVLG